MNTKTPQKVLVRQKMQEAFAAAKWLKEIDLTSTPGGRASS
jgi:hypothetical protein